MAHPTPVPLRHHSHPQTTHGRGSQRLFGLRQPHQSALLPTLRPRHHFCHQRTLALMELDLGSRSAAPVAFRCQPHQPTQRFVLCCTLQRLLRLPPHQLHPATAGARFRRPSIVSRGLFMVLGLCPSSKTLRMCSPTSSCCHGMHQISTTSTSER